MTVFFEMRFPEDIAFHSSGGPEFATEVVATAGGYEYRNSQWQEARARYNVVHGIKTQAELDQVIAFFRICKGKSTGFRFKDWGDYRAEGQEIGTGNGVDTRFQLKKHYGIGKEQAVRRIVKPVDNTVGIYVDNVVITGGLTVDYTTGEVIFLDAPAPGSRITANFHFDVPVRFDTDYLAVTVEAYEMGRIRDIPLIEIRLHKSAGQEHV